MKNTNKNEGITLIALVITIIVMLILVGVTINITVNGGLFEYAGKASRDTNKAKLIEEVQMKITAQRMENLGDNLTKNQLKSLLSEYFEDIDSLQIPDDVESSDIVLTAKQEHGGFSDIKLSDIFNDKFDDTSTICFGGKTVEEVNVGDDLTIGVKETRATTVEKFKIIKKEGTIITAVPYYNIQTTTNNPLQSGYSNTTSFSTSSFITSTGDIDMTNEAVIIQKYIDAYKTSLEAMGAKNINTRVGRENDFKDLTKEQRNPSLTGDFWVGTAKYGSGSYSVDLILETGELGGMRAYSSNTGTGSYKYGCRPLIEINTEGLKYITDVNKVNLYKDINIEQKLTELISDEDYGKDIDYSVTVSGQVLDNWKVFLNDGENVYLIFGEYLPTSLIPPGSDTTRNASQYPYCVWSAGDATRFCNWLGNTEVWSNFATGKSGLWANGTPNREQLIKSSNKPLQLFYTLTGTLYAPDTEAYDGCDGYWINYHFYNYEDYCWYINKDGKIYRDENGNLFKNQSIRPIVCLKPDAKGKIINNSVVISE